MVAINVPTKTNVDSIDDDSNVLNLISKSASAHFSKWSSEVQIVCY